MRAVGPCLDAWSMDEALNTGTVFSPGLESREETGFASAAWFGFRSSCIRKLKERRVTGAPRTDAVLVAARLPYPRLSGLSSR